MTTLATIIPADMVPDTGLRPGVQRHVVAHDAQVCGFPMPR